MWTVCVFATEQMTDKNRLGSSEEDSPLSNAIVWDENIITLVEASVVLNRETLRGKKKLNLRLMVKVFAENMAEHCEHARRIIRVKIESCIIPLASLNTSYPSPPAAMPPSPVTPPILLSPVSLLLPLHLLLSLIIRLDIFPFDPLMPPLHASVPSLTSMIPAPSPA